MTLQNSEDSPQGTSRRGLLRGMAAVGAMGVAGVAVSACGAGGRTTDTAPSGNKTSAGKKTPAAKAGGITAKTADVPAGGGKVLDSEKVVVTQPEVGQFKAFSAVCTHQGCTVSEVADGTINCPCHGSKFSITDGSVRVGPATKPLAQKQVAVEGDQMTIS